jgi:hypothetical protein
MVNYSEVYNEIHANLHEGDYWTAKLQFECVGLTFSFTDPWISLKKEERESNSSLNVLQF